jgi:hypothetical protein
VCVAHRSCVSLRGLIGTSAHLDCTSFVSRLRLHLGPPPSIRTARGVVVAQAPSHQVWQPSLAFAHCAWTTINLGRQGGGTGCSLGMGVWAKQLTCLRSKVSRHTSVYNDIWVVCCSGSLPISLGVNQPLDILQFENNALVSLKALWSQWHDRGPHALPSLLEVAILYPHPSPHRDHPGSSAQFLFPEPVHQILVWCLNWHCD